MNSTQLIGRIAQEPVYRELLGSEGSHVTELRLVVKGMGSGGRDKPGFIDVVSYTMTQRAAQTIGTGWLVAISGRLEHQTWEKNSQKRSKHRIVASRVEFLAAPRAAGDAEAPEDWRADLPDDIPF